MSASTGTADDRGGNDKLTPSLTWKQKPERSAQLLVGPPQWPVGCLWSIFYDTSRAGMHPGELEKSAGVAKQ
jgi:hypothetical protein